MGDRTPRREQAAGGTTHTQGGGQVAAPSRVFALPTLRAFEGAPQVVAALEAAVDEANARAQRLEHVLFTGASRSGKRLLAEAVIRELAQPCQRADGECVHTLSHLMELVRPLRARDVLLLRNVDRLPKRGQQYLAGMLEERRAPRPWRERAEKRGFLATVEQEDCAAPLPPFTLVATAATTEAMQPVLRARFELVFALPVPCARAHAAAVRRAALARGATLPEPVVASLSALPPDIVESATLAALLEAGARH